VEERKKQEVQGRDAFRALQKRIKMRIKSKKDVTKGKAKGEKGGEGRSSGNLRCNTGVTLGYFSSLQKKMIQPLMGGRRSTKGGSMGDRKLLHEGQRRFLDRSKEKTPIWTFGGSPTIYLSAQLSGDDRGARNADRVEVFWRYNQQKALDA